MSEGWIKLYRGLTKKAFYSTDSERVHLWIHLLLKATHSGREEMLGGRPVFCKAGQFTVGRKQLAIETGISESKIERTLTYFETKERQIEQRKTSTNRLISILNWEEYQEGEQQPNNDRTTSEQRVNTLQECKEGKEREECLPIIEKTWRDDFDVYLEEVTKAYNELASDVEFLRERERYHSNLDVRLSLEKSFKDFWGTEAGWKNKKKSRSKTLDWKSTFRNALSQKMNQVYRNKNDLFSQQSLIDIHPPKPQGRLLQ